MLALFEETILHTTDDIRNAVEAQHEPLARLHTFTIRLHEWCEPAGQKRKRGDHDRRPISEFSIQLALNHPDRVKSAMAPLMRMLVELLDEAHRQKVIKVPDARHTAMLMCQTIMYSWFGNRLVDNDRPIITAEEAWDFCVHGLRV